MCVSNWLSDRRRPTAEKKIDRQIAKDKRQMGRKKRRRVTLYAKENRRVISEQNTGTRYDNRTLAEPFRSVSHVKSKVKRRKSEEHFQKQLRERLFDPLSSTLQPEPEPEPEQDACLEWRGTGLDWTRLAHGIVGETKRVWGRVNLALKNSTY